jgi:hypothetical protein
MASEDGYRNFSKWEKELMCRLPAVKFPGQKEIAEQLSDCLLKRVHGDESLEFQNRSSTLAPVEKRIPVEAEAKDQDGLTIHALLHVVKGKATRLEFYKDDGSAIRRMPDPENWEVIVLPTPPSPGWQGGRLN